MWMLLLIGIMFVGMMGICFYGWWNNKQAEKYEQWVKQNKDAVA
jgi:Na+/proline symporter